jgi:hypothetical protein
MADGRRGGSTRDRINAVLSLGIFLSVGALITSHSIQFKRMATFKFLSVILITSDARYPGFSLREQLERISFYCPFGFILSAHFERV